jgi:hypothetical protein
MDTDKINKEFEDIMKPVKAKREPAKFPELRYLWGVSLLGSFVLIVFVSIITTILESV